MVFIKFFEKAISYFSEIALILFGIAAIFLLLAIFRDEGFAGVWSTLKVDVYQILVKFIVILAIFFVITGSLNHLQKRHPEDFRKILAGEKGKLPMILLAMVMPGPAGAGQLKQAWEMPDCNKTNVMLALTAMMALGINIYIYRARLLGGPLVLIWTIMAITLLAQVWLVCRFKPWTWFS